MSRRNVSGPVATPLPPKMSETAFMGRIIDVAKIYRWRVNHQRPAMLANGKWVTAVQGHAGFPDLALARRGIVLCREVKLDGKDLDPEQLLWGAELDPLWASSIARKSDAQRFHLLFDVWRPADWPLILRILSQPVR